MAEGDWSCGPSRVSPGRRRLRRRRPILMTAVQLVLFAVLPRLAAGAPPAPPPPTFCHPTAKPPQFCPDGKPCPKCGQTRCACSQSKPPGPLKFPTLLPPWEVEWSLIRSTIVQPCNYSGWFDPELASQFGVVSIDWANNENSWRSQPPPYPDQSDLITQARMIKAASKNRTKVFVYRQGQGAGSPAGRQATELLTDPIYDGFFLKSVGGAGALPAGTRVGGTFDFRNQTLVDYFINKYVGGPDCIANPHIDGWFADDVYGLGSPGSPDRTPTVKQSGLPPDEVAAWNRGQQAAVVGAQNLAVKKYGAFNWQNFQPMCEPGHDEPCPNGWTGMGAPNKASCIVGAPDFAHGKGFAGLRKLCSEEEGAALARDIPLLFLLWTDRNREVGRWPGRGSCTEKADCARDTCKQDGGGVDCSPIEDIRERIAAFSLVRGDYAWMGYNWMGCAGVDHKRKYYPFPGGPYKCPQNKSLDCSGYVDGARWLPPPLWDPAMSLELGGRPADICKEVADGVFERKFPKMTVRLDCNTFNASFIPADNRRYKRHPERSRPGAGGGYGGRGMALPPP